MEADFPAHPLIGGGLRLAYQHYAQDIDAALREAGFGDIRPGAANVFPFVPPDGITVSRLPSWPGCASSRWPRRSINSSAPAMWSAARTRATTARSSCSSPSAARRSPPSRTRQPSGWKSAGHS